MFLHEEIFEQPDVLQRLLETRGEDVRRVAQAIHRRGVAYVYLAGRGTSEHAGTYGQYLLGAFNRLPVALAAPSLFTLYHRPPRLDQALVIGISQSGQSPDIVSVVEDGRRQGALTLAITNNAASPLAQAAEFTLDIGAGVERAVAATKTYTAQAMALAMLSAALSESVEQTAELAGVPHAVAEALRLEPEIERHAARYRDMAQCVVLGRGYNFATALEWSLKLKELAYVVAERYSTAEFQHGPIALVEPGFPVLAAAPRDAGLGETVALLRRLSREHGADLLVLSDDDAALEIGAAALRLPADVPAWLTPIVAIVPAQLFCYHLTLARGFDPGAPRSLRKVTLTL
jgi:glucosamine--fructose-6-phosphate aminotransferase (isomerizing)